MISDLEGNVTAQSNVIRRRAEVSDTSVPSNVPGILNCKFFSTAGSNRIWISRCVSKAFIVCISACVIPRLLSFTGSQAHQEAGESTEIQIMDVDVGNGTATVVVQEKNNSFLVR